MSARVSDERAGAGAGAAQGHRAHTCVMEQAPDLPAGELEANSARIARQAKHHPRLCTGHDCSHGVSPRAITACCTGIVRAPAIALDAFRTARLCERGMALKWALCEVAAA